MRGFWSGFIFGVAVCAAIGFILTLAFPAYVFQEPRIDGVLVPKDLADPSPSKRPATPEAGFAAPDLHKSKPLIDSSAARNSAPGLAETAPTAAPDVFEGADSGSPSLVFPSQTN